MAVQPEDNREFLRPGTEEERPSGRKYQALSHQKFGMTPFEQQQHNVHLQNPLAHVDQKIEERESLRHSTHRSQRSDRATNLGGAHMSGQHTANVTGQHNLMNETHTTQAQVKPSQQMQGTHSDKFGHTDYNLSENQERPAFNNQQNTYQIDNEMDAERQERDQQGAKPAHDQNFANSNMIGA